MANLVTMILRESIRTEKLRNLIRQKQGRAFNLPLFTFEAIYDSPSAIEYLKDYQKYHWTVFSSPISAQSLHKIAVRNNIPLPKTINVAAPGQSTQKALNDLGYRNVFAPRGVSDISTMIKSKSFGRLKDRRVAIIQRENAPIKTFRAFQKRGAIPTTITCYHRIATDENIWNKLDPKLQSEINSIIAFDSASLAKLIEVANEDAVKIKDISLAVIHQSIALKAKELGFKTIIVSGEQNEMIKKLEESLPQDN